MCNGEIIKPLSFMHVSKISGTDLFINSTAMCTSLSTLHNLLMVTGKGLLGERCGYVVSSLVMWVIEVVTERIGTVAVVFPLRGTYSSADSQHCAQS